METLKQLLKQHDWFFEFADDRVHWAKGHDERKVILALIKEQPDALIPEIMNLVPEQFREAIRRGIQ